MGWKTTRRPEWASNRVAGLTGTQKTLTVLSARLITLNLWGKSYICICLCQISNEMLACNLDGAVQMIESLQGINESTAARSVFVASLLFWSGLKQCLFWRAGCVLLHTSQTDIRIF